MLKPHTTFLTWSILKRNSWGTHGARLGKSHCIGSVVEVAGLQLRCITVQRQPSVRGQIASRSRRVTSGGTCATKLLPIHLWSHVNCKLQSMVGTYWHMSEQVSVWRCLSKLASAFWCFFQCFFIFFLRILWLGNLAHSGTLVSTCFYSLTPPCSESSTANTLKKRASKHLTSDEGLDGLDWLGRILNVDLSWRMLKFRRAWKPLQSKRCVLLSHYCILYTADISCIESFRMHFSICLFWTEVRWVQTAAAAWIPSDNQPFLLTAAKKLIQKFLSRVI